MSDYVNSLHPSSLLRLNGLVYWNCCRRELFKNRQRANWRKEYSDRIVRNLVWSKPFRVVVLFRIENSGDPTLQTAHFQSRRQCEKEHFINVPRSGEHLSHHDQGTKSVCSGFWPGVWCTILELLVMCLIMDIDTMYFY